MADSIQILKSRARILHKLARKNDYKALQQLVKLKEFKKLTSIEIQERLQRRHCLTAIANECGFDGWSHAMHLLGGGNTGGFGDVLYPPRCGAHSNIWCSTYDEAKEIRDTNDGYLLGYKHQFLVVDEHFMRTLGIDPEDTDLQAMGKDWINPQNPDARKRLYGKIIDRSTSNQPLPSPDTRNS